MQREHYDDDDNRFISELFEEDTLDFLSTNIYLHSITDYTFREYTLQAIINVCV